MDAYAIVVDVDDPEPICLIEIPYADEFSKVARAIQAAANNIAANHVHFRPVRVDQLPKNQRFPEKIVQLTRSAKMIVAVCSPQGNSKHAPANPNVMYETGLAVALGKPLLILTTNASAMPADLAGFPALEYRAGESESALAARIEADMWKVLQGVALKPEAGYRNVWVARARHRILLQQPFWKSFNVVFRYASAVRDEMESISYEFVHDIRNYQRQIVEDDIGVKEFHDTWNRYVAHFEETTLRVLRPPADLDEAFRKFDDLARGSDSKQVERIDRFAGIVRRRIDEFIKSHNETRQICEQFFQGSPSDNLRCEFDRKVPVFVYDVRELVRYSGGLVKNLVALIAGGFDEGEARGASADSSAA